MQITNSTYIDKIKKLKQSYSDLPWYQRWWFSLWSYDLSSALSEINPENLTTEQVNSLYKMAGEAWFFKSIFGLLDEFNQAIRGLTYDGQTEDTKKELGGNLDINDLAALACTSKSDFNLFKSMVGLGQFLTAVTQCEYRKVGLKLSQDVRLFLEKGPITDNTGRCFSNISGFQYALWAGNKKMWLTIIESLPRNEQGESIKLKLLKQYQEVRDNGIRYRLEGTIKCESHYDFANTIIELQSQEQNMHNYNHGPMLDNWDKIDKQWRVYCEYAKAMSPFQIYDSLKISYMSMGGMMDAGIRNLLAKKVLSSIENLDKDFIELELLLNNPLVIDEQHLAAQVR